jgi:hypothetical protein
MGAGTFTVGGEITMLHWNAESWQKNQFNVAVELNDVELSLPDVIEATVRGSLLLINDGDDVVLTTAKGDPPRDEPLVVSNTEMGIPKAEFGGPPSPMHLAPAVRVRVLVGHDVWFRYGARRATEIKVEPGRVPEEGRPTGYLDIGGRASAEGLTLVGEFRSKEGVLAFPNGTLTLQEATAWLNRQAGGLPVVTVDAQASGRVGDYYVSLHPSGQVFPYNAELLQLNATSVPPLETGFVLALLGGTVVTPSATSQSDLAQLLRDPTRAQGQEGQITGVMVPAFSSGAGSEVGFDVGVSGQVRVRLAQKLTDRLMLSYSDSLTGPRGSYALGVTYQITHLWSVGRSVDELEQGRWEVQAFIPF